MLATIKQLLRPTAYHLVSVIFRQKAQLTPENLLAEYRQGRFPLTERFGRLGWHEPDQRAILPLDSRFHVPRNVRKLIRSERFTVTFDQAFRQVINECAAPTPNREWTWISPEIIEAYCKLHQLGHAHSVEVWSEDRLVGGGYGISIGGFFSGESMFSRESQTGKVALVHHVERLRERGFILLDSQTASNFSRQFGVIEIPRAEYKTLLADALKVNAYY